MKMVCLGGADAVQDEVRRGLCRVAIKQIRH